MKRAYILALCIALCVTMTLAGTISYLSDTDHDVNVMTVGNVKIELIELERGSNGLKEFEDMRELYPVVGSLNNVDGYGLPYNANFIDKVVYVKSNSRNADAFLRVFIGVPSALNSFEVDGDKLQPLHLYMGERVTVNENEHVNAANWPWEYDEEHSRQVEIDGVLYDMLCYNYNKLLNPGEEPPVLLGGVYLDGMVGNTDGNRYTIWHNGAQFELEMDMRNGVQIPVYVQATQADGFINPNRSFDQNRDFAFEEGGMNNVDFDRDIELEVLDGGEGSDRPDRPDGPGGDFGEETVEVNDAVEAIEQIVQGAESRNFKHILLRNGSYNFAEGDAAEIAYEIAVKGGLEEEPYQELIVPEDGEVELEMGDTMMPAPARLVVQGGELILTADVFVN